MTPLCLGLGLNLVLFASLMNVESGPRFANVWLKINISQIGHLRLTTHFIDAAVLISAALSPTNF